MLGPPKPPSARKSRRTGEHFVYNCTQASCGDCSPPCHILDATVMGGAQHLCGRQICTLGSPAPYDHCDQLLLELHRARPALSAPLQLPLPLPFALWSDRFLRNDALRTLQEEVLEAQSQGLRWVQRAAGRAAGWMDLVPASADAGALTVAEVRLREYFGDSDDFESPQEDEEEEEEEERRRRCEGEVDKEGEVEKQMKRSSPPVGPKCFELLDGWHRTLCHRQEANETVKNLLEIKGAVDAG
eukprot:Skav203048  [mRNA]  locus=scaffold845:126577:138131:+ [translate_table: standard]